MLDDFLAAHPPVVRTADTFKAGRSVLRRAGQVRPQRPRRGREGGRTARSLLGLRFFVQAAASTLAQDETTQGFRDGFESTALYRRSRCPGCGWRDGTTGCVSERCAGAARQCDSGSAGAGGDHRACYRAGGFGGPGDRAARCKAGGLGWAVPFASGGGPAVAAAVPSPSAITARPAAAAAPAFAGKQMYQQDAQHTGRSPYAGRTPRRP